MQPAVRNKTACELTTARKAGRSAGGSKRVYAHTRIHVDALAAVRRGQQDKFALAPGLSRLGTASSASDGSRGRRHRKNSRRCGSLDDLQVRRSKGSRLRLRM